MTENEPQIYKELDEQKAKIESLETAVKSMQEQIDKILKTMEELTLGKN